MKITKVEIHNWRSVKHLELDCQPLMVLVGPNNHGKSNVLSAIGFALTAGEKPAAEDFFADRERIDGEPDELWVELTFKGLSEQERKTFERYVGADGTLRVRKTAELALGSDNVDARYNGWLSQPQLEWLQANRASDLAKKRGNLKATGLIEYVPETGKLTKADIEKAQSAYVEDHKNDIEFEYVLEEGSFLGQKTVAAGVLPDWFLIPAVRDLTEETRIKNTATFGRLLTRAVQEMAETDPTVREVREHLEAMVNHLNAGEDRPQRLADLESAIQHEMTDWGATVQIRVEPPNISKVFELGTSLQVDDGVLTSAERKGHGMQRALMLALTQAWVRALRQTREAGMALKPRKGSDAVILAIEEPELFLHPHAQRRLFRNLLGLSEEAHHQVLLSTHSTHYADLDRPRSICIISKPDTNSGTIGRQCQVDLFAGAEAADRKKRFRAARWVNPDRAEMLFARRVAFVEGETEAALFPFLAEKLGRFDPEVSVVDCGSKFNLPLYIELAQAFDLDFVVVHDEDPVDEALQDEVEELQKQDPVDQQELDHAKSKLASMKRTFNLNRKIADAICDDARVLMVGPEIEQAAGVPKERGRKLGKPLAAIEHFDQEGAEIPEVVLEIIRMIYERKAADG